MSAPDWPAAALQTHVRVNRADRHLDSAGRAVTDGFNSAAADSAAADPTWLGKPGNGIRPLAARAALAAASGEGDAPRDEPGRAVLQGQALGWLRDERDAVAERDGRGSAGRRGDVPWPAGRRGTRNVPRRAARRPAVGRVLGVRRLGDGELPTHDQAVAAARRRNWVPAAEAYTVLVAVRQPEFGQEWFEVAAVQLLAGDEVAYRRTCARLASRHPVTAEVRGYHVARVCTLLPGGADRPRAALQAAAEFASFPNESWALTERGAILHRSGRSAEAVPLFERSLTRTDKVGGRLLNWLWLALAHKSLGQLDEARRWLGRARDLLGRFPGDMPDERKVSGLHLHDWLEAIILLREAEALLVRL